MAKRDKSLTTMATPNDSAEGEQNFVALHRDNTDEPLNKDLANNGKNGMNNASSKVKTFNRAKNHFGHDMDSSIDVYDKRVSEGLKAHKLIIGGQQVGVFHGDSKEAAKYAHRILKRHGKVAVKEDIIAELTGKGKLSDIAQHYQDLALSKTHAQDRDENDPDRHGELSFHKSLRAFALGQKAKGEEHMSLGGLKALVNRSKNPKASAFRTPGWMHEEINEVSSELLGRYIRKASGDAVWQRGDAGMPWNAGEKGEKYMSKAWKRAGKVGLAADKLVRRATKNESEELNELSKGLLTRYRLQARGDIIDHGRTGKKDDYAIVAKRSTGSTLASKKIKMKEGVIDEANSPKQLRSKFEKHNNAQLDAMLSKQRKVYGYGKLDLAGINKDSHRIKRTGQAMDAAYRLMHKEGEVLDMTKNPNYKPVVPKADLDAANSSKEKLRKSYQKVMPGQTRPNVVETLASNASAEDYIHDFVHSTDSRFDGKSKKERIKMALGAYYGKHESEIEANLVEKFEGNLPWVSKMEDSRHTDNHDKIEAIKKKILDRKFITGAEKRRAERQAAEVGKA